MGMYVTYFQSNGVSDMPLMRLAYASEAAFEARPAEKGMEPNVAQILSTSRRNNAKHELTGGLYYGGDRFFQYLEGEEKDLRETYQRILEDPRHKHIVTLIDEPIENRSISRWSMKYVPLSADIRHFLEEEGLDSFDPAAFSARQCESMIELIRAANIDESSMAGADDDVPEESKATSVGLQIGVIISGLCLLGALAYTFFVV